MAQATYSVKFMRDAAGVPHLSACPAISGSGACICWSEAELDRLTSAVQGATLFFSDLDLGMQIAYRKVLHEIERLWLEAEPPNRELRELETFVKVQLE